MDMAVEADLKNFREYFPQITNVNDAAVNQAIQEALRIHSADPLATLYCAAHLIAYKQDLEGAPELDGGSGIVSTEGVGPRNISFVNESQLRGGERKLFFESSPYGRIFLQLEYRNPDVRLGFYIGHL